MLKLLKKFMEWDGITPGEGGFVQAALTAAPYVLNALGGLFGGKKKYMDPEMARQKFGPAAIAKDAQAIANFILNSPYGQELLSQAATAGQDIQTQMAANAAMSGQSPDTGGASGASTFAAAAAPQAQGSLERGTKAGIFQAAIPAAVGFNQNLMALEQGNIAERNATPSPFQKIAAAAGQIQTIPGLNVRKEKKPGEEA